jgi:hypothetical protein
MKISNLTYTELAHEPNCLGGDIGYLTADLAAFYQEFEGVSHRRVVTAGPRGSAVENITTAIDLDTFSLGFGFDALAVT